MFGFYLLSVGLMALAGLVLYFFTKTSSSLGSDRTFSVTKTEWVVALLLASLVVFPTVNFLGSKIAKASAVSYNEYWSGLEQEALVKKTVCSKDGPCVHEYDCDAYTVWVTKTRTVSYTKPDGTTGTKTETYQEQETRYHDCPYVDAEYTYVVTDTMGETYTLGDHWFPSSPSDHRWTGSGYNDPRYGFGAPSLPHVDFGIPAPWAAAKARLDAGNPGGTTKRHSYKNYILASQDDIYAKHSEAIASYLEAGLLPKVTTEVYDEYLADKVYFMGVTLADEAAWEEAVQRFDGYLGSERQGDMHVVVVDASVNPDEYSQALEAYWQSEALGKNSLSKNGIGLVLGVDGSTVAWARGFTGMPMGNESLVQSFKNVANVPATPEALFSETGAVSTLVFDEDSGFNRVEMADYEYLYDSIEIGGWAKFFIFLVGLILSMGIWFGMMQIDLRVEAIENFFKKATA